MKRIPPFCSVEDDTPSWKDIPPGQALLLLLLAIVMIVGSMKL